LSLPRETGFPLDLGFEFPYDDFYVIEVWLVFVFGYNWNLSFGLA